MAVGPVGGAIYVNQQIPAVASEKTSVQNRFDLQNIAAAEATNSKEKEIEDVRPTEENHEVDPDREENKQEQEQKKKRRQHTDKDEKSEESGHRLDVKV